MRIIYGNKSARSLLWQPNIVKASSVFLIFFLITDEATVGSLSTRSARRRRELIDDAAVSTGASPTELT